jgi:hypothetical protein
MRKLIIRSMLAGALILPAPLFGQPQPTGGSEAERAALELEQLAAAAEALAVRTRQQAAAARRAANALPPGPAGETGPAPADENLRDFDPSPTPLSAVEAQGRFRDGIQESVANGPGYRSHKTTGSPEFQLVASDDKKVASLSLTMDVSGMPAEGGDKLNSTMLTLTASTELASSGPTSFGDLNGLANGTEVKLSLTHYESRFTPQDLNFAAVDAARTACLSKPAPNPEAPPECRPDEYPGGVTAFVMEYNPKQVRSFVDSVLPGPVIFYGVEGKASQAKFDYLDQVAFTQKKASRFSFSAGLFTGAILNSGNTSLGGSLTWARQRKAQDPITLCQAINAIPQTQCITAAAGLPKLKEKLIVAGEVRHAFSASMGNFAKFAIAPQFSYDLLSDAYGVDVPIYLAGDGKGKLRGGIRAGYTNEKKVGGGRDDDFTLGVFLGVPFSVFR